MKRLVTYAVQAGGAVSAGVGLYFAFHQAQVFFPILLGAGVFFAASYYRTHLDSAPISFGK